MTPPSYLCLSVAVNISVHASNIKLARHSRNALCRTRLSSAVSSATTVGTADRSGPGCLTRRTTVCVKVFRPCERTVLMASLHDPLTLPCGLALPNRIMKAALSEVLGDTHNAPDARLERLYTSWSRGGYGLIVTGNVMVDGTQFGRAGQRRHRRRAPPRCAVALGRHHQRDRYPAPGAAQSPWAPGKSICVRA